MKGGVNRVNKSAIWQYQEPGILEYHNGKSANNFKYTCNNKYIFYVLDIYDNSTYIQL